jgi:hypothetical protein
MKKYIVALAALVALAVPTAGMAASTNANGVVAVSKGEVMAQFPGMNESAFQNGPKVLTGSNVFTATTDTGVGCSDGTTQHHYRNTIITTPNNFAPIVNHSNGKTTGWTMTKGAQTIAENNTYGTSPSGRFPNYATICEGHGYVTSYFQSLEQSHSDVTSYTFNGMPVSIVVTPYVAPTV